MAKRAASVSQQPASKVARTEVGEEYAAALALVKVAVGLPDECRAMLQAMAPHCLNTPGAERHAYQAEMVQVLSGVCAGVESQRRAAVATAEANVVDAQTETQSTDLQLSATEQEVQRSRAACDGEAAVAKTAGEAVVLAKQALADVEKRMDSLASERACAEVEKEEYEGVMRDALLPLKEGAFTGKQARARDKMIKLLMEVLSKLSLDRSLLDSLPVGFKTKVEARGPFAKMAVTCGEQALQEHVVSLSDAIARKEKEVAEHTEVLQRAQEAVAAAQNVLSATLDAHVASENVLHKAETAMKEAAVAVKALKVEFAQRSSVLDQSRVELESVLKLVAQFVELRDGPEEIPAPVDVTAEVDSKQEKPAVPDVVVEVSKADSMADMAPTIESMYIQALTAGA